MIIVDKCSSKICRYGSKTGKKYGWVGGFFLSGPHTPVTFLDRYPPRDTHTHTQTQSSLTHTLSHTHSHIHTHTHIPTCAFKYRGSIFNVILVILDTVT